jgi:imidazolonepropionase-like amidohydrolase
MRVYRLLLTALILLSGVPVLPQNPAPLGIRPEAPEGKGVVALKAARLIDGTGAAPLKNAIIIVANNKISVVGDAASVRIPSGVKVIDLGDVTLLPGFIDAHTHLIGRVLGDPEGDMAPVKDYDSFGAILGVLHARDTLMAGFTSVRNVGASGQFDDMALRKAINEGWTIGPRMETAGHAIGITGGHCDENGFRPGVLQLGPMDGVANGPEEIRAAVRYQIKYGADVIKTCATGGVLSEGDAVGATQYSFEELKALVDCSFMSGTELRNVPISFGPEESLKQK